MDIPWSELTGTEKLRTAHYHELSVADRSAFDAHMEVRRRIAGHVAASAPNHPAAAPAPRQRPAAPRPPTPAEAAAAEGRAEARELSLAIVELCARYNQVVAASTLIGKVSTAAEAEAAIHREIWTRSFAAARSRLR